MSDNSNTHTPTHGVVTVYQRPEPLQAMQIPAGYNYESVEAFTGGKVLCNPHGADTLVLPESGHRFAIEAGDWVMRDTWGRWRRCNAAAFREWYEVVGPSA